MTDHAAVVREGIGGYFFTSGDEEEITTAALAALAALEQELAEAKRERDELEAWTMRVSEGATDAATAAEAAEAALAEARASLVSQVAYRSAAEARVKELNFSLGLSEKAQKVFRDRAVAAEAELAEAKKWQHTHDAAAKDWQEELERREAAEAALAEAKESLGAYTSALSGTQYVRDEYKARATTAETRVDELADELAEAKRERDEARRATWRYYCRADAAEMRAEAAEAALAEAKQRIAYLTAEAHGWQPRLAKAEEALRDIAYWTFKGDDVLAIQEHARAALAREDA